MPQAIVQKPYAPLYVSPNTLSLRLDEVLLGMAVTVTEEKKGWALVRTPWGAEGYMESDALCLSGQGASEWMAYGKMTARSPFVDVLEGSSQEGPLLAVVPRGGMVHPLSEEDVNGFLLVELPGGQQGYAKGDNLMVESLRKEGQPVTDSLRESIGAAALSYLGAQYRYGGRTMYGLCSFGLVAMSYQLNGFTIPADRDFEAKGFVKKSKKEMAMGDILCFGTHLALYLGDDNYIHATSAKGSDGVVINSMNPTSPFFRKDLDERFTGCMSCFTQ